MASRTRVAITRKCWLRRAEGVAPMPAGPYRPMLVKLRKNCGEGEPVTGFVSLTPAQKH